MDQQMLLAQFRNIMRSKNKVGLQQILQKLDVTHSVPDNSPDYNSGKTCLHFAAAQLDLATVKDLITRGADLFKQESDSECTPLHQTTWCIDALQQYKLRWKIQGRVKEEPVVDALLSEQIKSGDALNPKNKSGLSHLHIACIFNHTKGVEFLKDGISDVTCADRFGLFPAGYTALHFSVRYSSVEATKMLLDYGADIHAKDVDGVSPVHLLISRLMDATDFVRMGKRECCLSYHREIKSIESTIILFLQCGKANFVDDTGLSALHLACCLRDSSIAQEYFLKNSDLHKRVHNNSTSWSGWTPAHFAACFSPKNFKFLLQNGASVNAKSTKGESPLESFMARYPPEVIHSTLSTKAEFKNIFFTDKSTNLLDTISLMSDCKKFHNFLQTLPNVDISVPTDSPLFPGYTFLHLAVSMPERKNLGPSIYPKTSSEEKLPPLYNCTTTDKSTYWKRIVVCLANRCSLIAKNIEGSTPIHLAFNLHRLSAVEKLINCCRDDAVDPRGLSHFHIACAVGNGSFVEKFMNENNVNSPVKGSFEWFGKTFSNITKFLQPLDPQPYLIPVRANATPLHLAVIFENREIVEYLVDNGADVHAEDALGLTPIHLSMASCSNSKDLPRILLRKTVDLRDCVTRGLSYLHVAAFVDDAEALEKLIDGGAKVDTIFDIPKPKHRPRLEYHLDEWTYLVNFIGQTPLHVAVNRRCADAVRVLLLNNADVHVGKESPVQCLMENLKHDVVEHFIRKFKRDKREVGSIDESNVTALHLACATFDLKWTRKLLDLGADVNATIRYEDECLHRNGDTPLHLMIFEASMTGEKPSGMEKLLKLLLKRGADVTVQNAVYETPLYSAYVGRREILRMDGEETDDAKFLLIAGDLMLKSQKSYAKNPANKDGFTHFHYACTRNNVDVVEKFLDNGVEVDLRTDWFSEANGFTPLHFACENEGAEVVRVLIERGANVKAKDAEGNLPIHVALNEGFVDERVIDLMMRSGVDINAKNIYGTTPLKLLIQAEYTVEELKSKGWLKEQSNSVGA